MSLFIYLYLFDDLLIIIRVLVWLIAILGILSAILLFIIFLLTEKEKYLLRKTERMVLEKQAFFNQAISPSGQVIISTRNREWQNKQYVMSATTATTPAITPGSTIPDALDVLRDIKRGLVVGVTDTGKTTLLRHMINQSDGRVIVIDPHASPGKWGNAIVVGASRNYTKIDECLKMLISKMNERYQDIATGKVKEFEHEPILVVIEEWRLIVKQLGKSAKDTIRTLLTESNKAAFRIFVTSQSDRAEPLGLDGEYDLRDSFAIVRLSIANGKRSATVDLGNGQFEVRLPGPMDDSRSEDDLFVELVNRGMSRRKASVEAYGVSYAGAAVDRGKKALGEL